MRNFRAIRQQIFRMTQEEFAVVIGVNQSTISRWEAGTQLPDLNDLIAIRSAALRLAFNWDDDWFWVTAA